MIRLRKWYILIKSKLSNVNGCRLQHIVGQLELVTSPQQVKQLLYLLIESVEQILVIAYFICYENYGDRGCPQSSRQFELADSRQLPQIYNPRNRMLGKNWEIVLQIVTIICIYYHFHYLCIDNLCTDGISVKNTKQNVFIVTNSIAPALKVRLESTVVLPSDLSLRKIG